MTKTKRIPQFITSTLEVQWAHLHDVDTHFGVNSANHNISVIVNDELQEVLDTLLADTGATKINALRDEVDKEKKATGRMVLKAKTTLHAKNGPGPFPCVDSNTQKTDKLPFAGDSVRLSLAPVRQEDGSLSIYLNGCQIVAKNSSGFGADFEPTEGWSDDSEPQGEDEPSEPVDEDDIPF